MPKAGVLYLAVLVIAGCKALPNAHVRNIDLEGGTSVLTDARLRIIANHEPDILTSTGQVVPRQIVCVEYSPDVATSIVDSLKSAFKTHDTEVSLSRTQSEQILKIAERTLSIQLMREQMFRACEAYSNGAISSTTYTLIMSRLNETIVTLLMGEVVAGHSRYLTEPPMEENASVDVDANGKGSRESQPQKKVENIASILLEMQRIFFSDNGTKRLIDACIVELGVAALSTSSTFDLLNNFTKSIGEPKNGELTPGQGRTLKAAQVLTRQSGLYDFCKTNFMAIVSAQNSWGDLLSKNLELAVDIKRSDEEARRLNRARQYLEFCNTLGEAASRVKCQGLLLDPSAAN